MGHPTKTDICNFQELADLLLTPSVVPVPSCDGSLINQTVDNVSAVYLLNQHNFHTERVYDVATATISGNITYSVAGSVGTINHSALAVTNDTILGYYIDWGNGFTDIINPGGTTTSDFVDQPSEKYEAKVYVILNSTNIILLTGIEFTWNGAVLAPTIVSPRVINRSYQVKIAEVLQKYCDSNTVGPPFNANGSAYTVVGAISLTPPNIYDERLDAADITLNTGPIIPLENASQNRITGVLALASTTVTNPTFTGARDVTVYNSKNVTVAFEYTTTVNGTFKRVNIPSGGTWSNTLKRDDYSNEGTYVSGRIVAAYTATTAAGEININWTT